MLILVFFLTWNQSLTLSLYPLYPRHLLLPAACTICAFQFLSPRLIFFIYLLAVFFLHAYSAGILNNTFDAFILAKMLRGTRNFINAYLLYSFISIPICAALRFVFGFLPLFASWNVIINFWSFSIELQLATARTHIFRKALFTFCVFMIFFFWFLKVSQLKM